MERSLEVGRKAGTKGLKSWNSLGRETGSQGGKGVEAN